MTVTAEQKKLLQSTANVLKEDGKEIMAKFYSNLFREHPEYRNFFNETNQKTGKQPAAMALTIYYFVENLDNLEKMTPQMARVSAKHRATFVRPEYYPVVGKYMLEAIKDSLGKQGTPDVVAAWQALYNLMASTFIKEEKELYAKLGNNEAEQGFATFTIQKKEVVAGGPTYAVTLTPKNGGKVPPYQSGQYITLRVEKNGVLHNGYYPVIESYNGNNYTVAFKQGYDTEQNSIVSEEIVRNYVVGSYILVSPPAGSFALASDAKNHLFISGGIGITSFLAMLEDLQKQGKASSATLVQCVRTEFHAAFADKLRNILPQGQYLILTQEDPISKEHLQGKVKSDTHVYLSGSEVFIAMAENALSSFNVPKSQIHYKSIEPTLRLLKSLGK
jgi:nitric oxide dioxygenase